jgi:uncharacterized DUF497 family protein
VLELGDEPLTFEWDEINEAHVREHGLWDWEVDQVLSNEHVVVPNKRRRSRRLFLIGRTDGGQVVTVVIEKTRLPGTYRPVSARPSSKSERAVLEKG